MTGVAACGPEATDAAEPSKNITLGFIPSWTDGRSMGNLLKAQLEDMGYTVSTEELGDPGPLYVGLAQGDVDIYPSAWPEVTHSTYMDEYGDRIESLGAYYDGAVLTWAVPEYSELKSIADVKDHAAELDNRIIGIEPGAGLSRVSQEDVIPGYGLEDFELVTSSTAAMLAELKTKIAAQEEIVVTLWRPFWANAEFGVRDLEDPEGALGDTESLHFLARKGFGEEYPDIAEWIGELKLDDEQYGSLENTVVNEFDEGQEADAIKAWTENNPDVLPEA
nr:glycine betaine ABC transporter substrate-binding protein [Tessaracoccus sp. MC1756]